MKQLFIRLKQALCVHLFDLGQLKLNAPEFEDTDKRVIWPCCKCGKVFTAHCGLDIAPQKGFIKPRPRK